MLQLGNAPGFTAVGPASSSSLIATVVSEGGANFVTVSTADVRKLRIGMFIDILNRTTGAAVASNRQINGLTAGGNVFYSGADVTGADTDGIYPAGSGTSFNSKVNVNGGFSDEWGFGDGAFMSVAGMKARLRDLDATTYTEAYLARLTANDLAYAVRTLQYSGSIR